MQHGHAEPPKAGRCRDATDVSADEDEQGLGTLRGKHGEQPLQVDGEAGRRQLLPETSEEVVVTPAVGDGEPEPGGVRLVDRARVVVVTTGESEVEDDSPERPMRLEVAQYLPQVLEGLLRLLPHCESPGLLDNGFILRRTDDARDAAHAGGGVGRQLPSYGIDGNEVLRGQGTGYGRCGVGRGVP